MEITIISEGHTYEPSSELPSRFIKLDNGNTVSKRYAFRLLPARNLGQIEGKKVGVYIKATEYSIFGRTYNLMPDRILKAVIRGTEIIPLLRPSEGSEKHIRQKILNGKLVGKETPEWPWLVTY